MRFTVDEVDLTQEAQPGKAETFRIHEKYPWRGIHSEAVNHCNGARIPVVHAKGGAKYTLEIRAFDDGVAFRHIIPGDSKSRVPDEGTRFILPEGSTVWYHDLEGHYEDTHERKAVAEIEANQWVAPPLTFKLPGGAGYASITEAALVNYSGMALQADPTVQYAISLKRGKRKSRLFEKDYQIQSPYNTYLNPGLPPGPVNSPSRRSLEAALYPANVHYLYFVAGPDGRHIFSRTYNEHLRAVRKVRKAGQRDSAAVGP